METILRTADRDSPLERYRAISRRIMGSRSHAGFPKSSGQRAASVEIRTLLRDSPGEEQSVAFDVPRTIALPEFRKTADPPLVRNCANPRFAIETSAVSRQTLVRNEIWRWTKKFGDEWASPLVKLSFVRRLFAWKSDKKGHEVAWRRCENARDAGT